MRPEARGSCDNTRWRDARCVMRSSGIESDGIASRLASASSARPAQLACRYGDCMVKRRSQLIRTRTAHQVRVIRQLASELSGLVWRDAE